LESNFCRCSRGKFDIRTLADIETLSESVDLECKLAAGRDGKGQLPNDFWPTYSTFANTHAGIILLGVKEQKRRFSLHGLGDPQRIITTLFNHLNNRQKVSSNLLTDKDVNVIRIDGKDLIQIHIPAANRKQKPVYLNGNPFKGNTYRRLHEGDRPCRDEFVKRMLAEQVEESRDTRILTGFSLADLWTKKVCTPTATCWPPIARIIPGSLWMISIFSRFWADFAMIDKQKRRG
jgi:predicted HTH transcriptional regulator